MGKDSREIRREIEETRARMGDTVEALGYKTDVKSRVRDAVNDRVETVRGSVSSAVGAVGRALGSVQEAAGGAVSGAESAVVGARNRASGAAGSVGDAAGGLAARVPDVGGGARRAVGLAAENPLGLAIGALAVGFLAGLAIPVSDLEAEQVGPRVGALTDQLTENAQELGSQLVEHGKAALGEVRDAALSAAQQHGGELAQSAREMVGASGSATPAEDAVPAPPPGGSESGLTGGAEYRSV